MTKVTINYCDNSITDFEVKGHSNFASKGNDIVCAGISAIVTGGLNAIFSLVENYKVDYELRDGYVKIKSVNNMEVQKILNVIIVQLKTIEESYPKHIKIVESYQ